MNDTMTRRPWLLILLAVYAIAAAVTLAAWSARGVYGITGDEPHYLVIASALLNDHTLDVGNAYLSEFATRAISSLGLAPDGAPLAPPYAHIGESPSGTYSWHGTGVPFLVMVPFALAGATGARLMMVLLGALAVVIAWRVSGVLMTGERRRFWSVLAIAIAYPLIPAATQIYPDLLAGIIALSGVYLVLSPGIRRRDLSLVGYSLIIGYLPWLGSKFLPTALVLLVGAVWSQWHLPDRVRRAIAVLGPGIAVMVLLGIGNVAMFGSPVGPPAGGTLEASRTAVMVFGGLLLDQDQGILLQNPALWLGLLGLVPFIRRWRGAAIVWGLTLLTIWIPSAMHPGWYGEGSLIGRYSWALALLAIVPALVGLELVASWSRRAFAIVVAGSVAIHLVFFAWTTFTGGAGPGVSRGIDLYTKDSQTWLESYAVFYFPLHDWFPALYNVDWAFGFLPNLTWLLLAASVVALGARPRVGRVLVPCAVAAVVAAGFVAVPGARAITQPVGVTAEGVGYTGDGLAHAMRLGTYDWVIDYLSPAPAGVVAGRWELVSAADGSVAASGELPGTLGRANSISIPVPFRALHPREFILRTASYGQGPLTVQALGVRYVSRPAW